jgi:pyruvate/2-oxoglutarate/acetoin dehydrogenase E1 component
MWEALREATDEEMERDPTVCVMGECGSGPPQRTGGGPGPQSRGRNCRCT